MVLSSTGSSVKEFLTPYVLEYRNKRLAVIHLKDYDPAQQAFLNFVLSQYIKQGVHELDDSKLGDLLKLNYGAIDDAKKQLGSIQDIRGTFIEFQAHLYNEQAS